MKVYDIVLAVIRALVVLDIIREFASLIPYGLRLAAIYAAPGYAEMRQVEVANFFTPLIGVIVSLIIFAFAKPIARFAAKHAAPADAAGHFS